jgi:anti-anti-sigma regulatory factor
MTSIHYESGLHRLRLQGACRDTDAQAIEEALTAFAKPGTTLTVDLTAVTSLAPEVARRLVEARDQAPEQGHQVALIRKAGSNADRELERAEPKT